MGLARCFQELEVHRLAFKLQQDVFALSRSFPREELYSLTDQVRRSSRAVGANIAEAWAKRRYPAHFVSKLSDADAESNETRHWLDTGLACSYIAEDTHTRLATDYVHLGAMLGRMIESPDSWSQTH